jgi:hypothetical protein
LTVSSIKHNPSSAPSSEPSLSDNLPVSRLRRLCRSFGLDSLYIHLAELKNVTVLEPRKVVLVDDLRTACGASLLHVVPVAASILLIVLNCYGFYIGGELSGPTGQDDLKFLGLQFAAKIMELMMMASLSCIIFSLIRHLALNSSLPFGAITSGFEFSRISWLWSKEFVATCFADFGTVWTKSLLVAMTVVFALLGATVGPSAAVASQPTLRDWSAGGTKFYLNASWEQLFPLVLDEVAPSEMPCILGAADNTTCFPSNYRLLSSELLSHWPTSISQEAQQHYPPVVPEKTLLSGRKSLHQLANRLKGGFIFSPTLTVATTPMVFITDTVALLASYWFLANQSLCRLGKIPSFCYYRDLTNSVEIIQPISYTICQQNKLNSSLAFARLNETSSYPLTTLNNSNFGSTEWFANATQNGSHQNVTWIALPESDFGANSLGAIVALPGSNTSANSGQILTCTIDVRWVNSTATQTFLGGPMVVTGSFGNWDAGARFNLDSKGQPLWPQLKITPRWAEHLNAIIDRNGTSVFEYMTNSVGNLNNITAAPYSSSAVEAVLALMITEGVSRVGNAATLKGSLKGISTDEWWKHILPGGRIFGTAGSAFDYVPATGDNFAAFTMQSTVNGYGYGPTTATILSILVLAIYSLIAVIYVICSTCIHRSTSTAWESMSELVALAANSNPPSVLRNTGGGISTLSTLKQGIYINSQEGRLGIRFMNEDEPREEKLSSKVVPKSFYS